MRSTGLQAAAVLAVLIVSFLLSASAVLGAGGGFVSYRTIPISTVIAAILFIYAIWMLGHAVGRQVLAVAALTVTAIAAVAGNFEMNYLTMKLARNETAYFNGIVRQAIDSHSKAVIIVDPRPFSLPEDHPVVYDQHGRSIPPYELSCFSGVCLQNGSIVTILAEQQGVPRGKLLVYSMRGDDPVPNASCALVTDRAVPIPASLSASSIEAVKYLRTLSPVTCVDYSLAWRTLD